MFDCALPLQATHSLKAAHQGMVTSLMSANTAVLGSVRTGDGTAAWWPVCAAQWMRRKDRNMVCWMFKCFMSTLEALSGYLLEMLSRLWLSFRHCLAKLWNVDWLISSLKASKVSRFLYQFLMIVLQKKKSNNHIWLIIAKEGNKLTNQNWKQRKLPAAVKRGKT